MANSSGPGGTTGSGSGSNVMGGNPPNTPTNTTTNNATNEAAQKAILDLLIAQNKELEKQNEYVKTDTEQSKKRNAEIKKGLAQYKQQNSSIVSYYNTGKRIKELEKTQIDNAKTRMQIQDTILRLQSEGKEVTQELLAQEKALRKESAAVAKELEAADKAQASMVRNSKLLRLGFGVKNLFAGGTKMGVAKGKDFIQNATGLNFNSIGGLLASAIGEAIKSAGMGLQVQAHTALETWDTLDELQGKIKSFQITNIKGMKQNFTEEFANTAKARVEALKFGLSTDTAINLMKKMTHLKNVSKKTLSESRLDATLFTIRTSALFRTSTDEMADLILDMSQKMDRPFNKIKTDIESVAYVFDAMKKETGDTNLKQKEFARTVFDTYKTMDQYSVRLSTVSSLIGTFYKSNAKFGLTQKENLAYTQKFAGILLGTDNAIPDWMRYMMGEKIVKKFDVGGLRKQYNQLLKSAGAAEANKDLEVNVNKKVEQMGILGDKGGAGKMMGYVIGKAVKGQLSGYDTVRASEEIMRGTEQYGKYMYDMVKDLGQNYGHGTTLIAQQLGLGYKETLALNKAIEENDEKKWNEILEQGKKEKESKDVPNNVRDISSKLGPLQAASEGGILGMLKSILYGVIEKIPYYLKSIYDTVSNIFSSMRGDKYAKQYKKNVSEILKIRMERADLVKEMNYINEQGKTGNYDSARYKELYNKYEALRKEEEEKTEALPEQVKRTFLNKALRVAGVAALTIGGAATMGPLGAAGGFGVGMYQLNKDDSTSKQMKDAKYKRLRVLDDEKYSMYKEYVTSQEKKQVLLSAAKAEGGQDTEKTRDATIRILKEYKEAIAEGQDAADAYIAHLKGGLKKEQMIPMQEASKIDFTGIADTLIEKYRIAHTPNLGIDERFGDAPIDTFANTLANIKQEIKSSLPSAGAPPKPGTNISIQNEGENQINKIASVNGDSNNWSFEITKTTKQMVDVSNLIVNNALKTSQ